MTLEITRMLNESWAGAEAIDDSIKYDKQYFSPKALALSHYSTKYGTNAVERVFC